MTTGNISGASSSAAKQIVVVGPKGRSEPIRIGGTSASCRKGQTDTFDVCVASVGIPEKVIVVNEGRSKTDGWFCDKIELRSGKTGKAYRFPAKTWLSLHEAPCSLTAEVSRVKGSGKNAQYQINVTTADEEHAGTTSHVSIRLTGVKGGSAQMRLAGQHAFRRGRTDVFHVSTPSIGKLTKIQIEHDNTGGSPSWKCTKIIVKHLATDNSYTFHVDKWLSRDHDDRQISRDVFVSAQGAGAGKGANTTYTIRVYTGDVRGAGTDANVTVILFGDAGEGGPYTLDRKVWSLLNNLCSTCSDVPSCLTPPFLPACVRVPVSPFLRDLLFSGPQRF